MRRTIHPDTIKYDDVNIGEYVDMESGCFLERRSNSWIQWDGGFGLAVSEEDVKKWLSYHPTGSLKIETKEEVKNET